jgi:cytochrome P450
LSTSAAIDLLSDPLVIKHPYALYEAVRENNPVFELPGLGFLVTRYDDVTTVLRNPDVFSSSAAYGQGFATTALTINARPPSVDAVLAQGVPEVSVLTQIDGSDHRRQRALVSQAFSPGRVRQIEDAVRSVGDELVDRFIGRGGVELRSEFSERLPMTVLSDSLGVPRDDLSQFKRWSDAAHSLIGAVVPEDDYVAVAHEFLEFQRYFTERIEERRAVPRDDLLSDLLWARGEDDQTLTLPELLNIVMQLLIAGNQTTASATCSAMYLLLQDPPLLERLRDDLTLIPSFIEESLRLESPVQGLPRATTVATELGGVVLPKGSKVVVMFGAANRDPRQFPDPDTVDLTRPKLAAHVSFGHGAHHCLGAALGRSELRIGIELLLSRLQNLRLAPDFEPEYLPSLMVRGLRELTFEFDPA